MVFSSFQFFPFFIGAILIYFVITNPTGKKLLLIVASYCFYALFNPWYVLLLGAATPYTWLATEALERAQSRRRMWLWVGVGGPLILLGYFKYAVFVQGNVAWLFDYWEIHRSWSIAQIFLPAGISFYLFHSISYVIDVYRGTKTASLLDYTLYVAFFPQLVSGPIVRRKDFIPQAEDPKNSQLDWEKINWGLAIFIFGLFQKVVLADGVFADVAVTIFDRPQWLSFADAWLGVIAFSGQIFFDFSGYSTSAIGISLCFGYRLPSNFRYPYAAIGFSDFWRRWHISLSSWLRDYLYISLGGNRHGSLATYRNLMLTMLLGGLWHGAAWTFVAWGLLHGLYLVGEKFLSGFSYRSRIWPALGWGATLVLTMVAWVFFRAATFGDAFAILKAMFAPTLFASKLIDGSTAVLAIAAFGVALGYSLYMRRRSFPELWATLPFGARAVLLGLSIFLVLAWRGEPREFIYFAF